MAEDGRGRHPSTMMMMMRATETGPNQEKDLNDCLACPEYNICAHRKYPGEEASGRCDYNCRQPGCVDCLCLVTYRRMTGSSLFPASMRLSLLLPCKTNRLAGAPGLGLQGLGLNSH